MSYRWEIDSVCPKCGSVNHLVVPAGETVVRVQCVHCTHGFEYTHVIAEYQVQEDNQGE